jgi:tetratricopeptide (TPR) repeat protein
LLAVDAHRPDRSGSRGLRVAAGSSDLIEDIHRQQRRRTFKRAAQFVALAVALLLVGLAVRIFTHRQDQARALETAGQQLEGGTATDLRSAIVVLEPVLERHPDHPGLAAMDALARAHLWAEFGVGEDEANAAALALDENNPAAPIVDAMLAFAAGDLEAADASIADVEPPADSPFMLNEVAWLRAMLAATKAETDPEGLKTALSDLEATLEADPAAVSLRRVQAWLLLLSGDGEASLDALEKARDQSRSHLGLAADEALYNAHLHQELGGVASVADQLLEMQNETLSPRDRAHAQLARAVANVRNGEPKEGLERLEAAWGDLAPWNVMARRLALQTALEANNTALPRKWIEDSGLPDVERDIVEAWITLLEGDIMKCLDLLEKAPQAHPLVAYLQALALVEQRRFEEAKPWVERTDKLMPGRAEVEVASARIELRLGEKSVALRKLEALAEQEAYAPRAWTGLGEAHLLQEGDARDLKKAKKALQKAVEIEPVPAEALLLLAGIAAEKKDGGTEGKLEALELFEKAASAGSTLPHYDEALAMYLADLGLDHRAIELLRKVTDTRGVTWPVVMRRAELELETGNLEADFDALFEQAKELGAPARAMDSLRARIALANGTKESVLEAQAAFRKLLEEQPADVHARVGYAMSYLKQFDRKEADMAVRRGLSVTPDGDVGLLWLARAEIASRTGKIKNAALYSLAAWNRILQEPTRTAAEILECGELTVRMWVRQKQDARALRIARELTDRVGYHTEAWTIRASAQLAAGEALDARVSADRAIELDPKNARAHEIRGHTLLRFGDKKNAKEAYEQAVEAAKGTAAERDYRANLKRL